MNHTQQETDPRETHLDAVLAEYLRAIDDGQPVDRDTFLRQFGEHADQLRELLHAADLIEQMAGPRVVELPHDEDLDFSVGNAPSLAADETQAFLAGQVASPDDATRSFHQQMANAQRAPERLGEYELLNEIGRGGMGVVYRARQMQLDRVVAVKMILAGRFASADDVQRFYTEAQAAAKLDHPNVVAIYQVGEIDGHHYFSMDYIEGTDLASMLADGPLAPELAARYLSLIADAIDYAHSKGILHRDLKPANILIDELDRPLVSDFGLAKYLGQHEGLTASGLALGTPSYMSPEQAAGRHMDVGPATDIYALGAILYAMLTGQPPHRGHSPVDTILKVIHQEPQPPSEVEPSARGELETICLKCLQKDPKERYASARELAEDLRRYLRGEPIEAQPASPLVRTARWVQTIPLIAALTGRRVLEPTVAHRRVQSALLAMMLLVPLLFFLVFAVSRLVHNRLPAVVRVATGPERGLYHDFGRRLADSLEARTQRSAQVTATSGSGENRDALLGRSAHLALLQAGAVRGTTIVVVAPLYHEAVHVIVRRGRGISRVTDLAGKIVVVGAAGSGSWLSARTVLNHYELDLADLETRELPLATVPDDTTIDAAVVTIGLGSESVHSLLASGDFDLLPIDDAQALSLRHAVYRPYVIRPSHYPNASGIPSEGVATIATTAYLATRADAPDVLIATALETIYETPSLADGLIPRAYAAEWQGLALHPAARRYYERYATGD